MTRAKLQGKNKRFTGATSIRVFVLGSTSMFAVQKGFTVTTILHSCHL